MEFNPSKCDAITLKSRPVKAKYNLHSTTLETHFCQVPWCPHQQQTHMELTHWYHNKASQTLNLNFVRRNFLSCPTHIREQCYKTLVRPQLEYSSSVWVNSVRCNINKVESIQRNAAHFTCRDYRRTSSVTAMLQKLQWDSLQQQRAHSRVLMLYRIQNGLIAIPTAAYLEPVTICTRYLQIQCNTRTYSQTFCVFPRLVTVLNL